MSKITLVNSLLEIPDVLQERIFGEIPEIAVPETEADAMIAVGKLSAHLNNCILAPLSGLDVVELLLRVGQRNSNAVASVLANLEVIASDGGGKLTILAPTDGAVIPNYAEFACSGNGIQSASVDVDGEAITLTQDGDTWSGYSSTPIPSGKHSASFTATFGDGSTASAMVNFETTANMELVATFPENETSYRPEEITEISATLSDEAALNTQAVNVSVFGQTLTLEQQAGNVYKKDLASLNLSLFDWAGLNLMVVSVENADGTTTEEIRFEIRGGEEGGA